MLLLRNDTPFDVKNQFDLDVEGQWGGDTRAIIFLDMGHNWLKRDADRCEAAAIMFKTCFSMSVCSNFTLVNWRLNGEIEDLFARPAQFSAKITFLGVTHFRKTLSRIFCGTTKTLHSYFMMNNRFACIEGR